MQRISRSDLGSLSAADIEQVHQGLALIKQYLPYSCYLGFARPQIYNHDQLDWLSERTGKLQAYSTLGTAEQKALLQQAEQNIDSVRALQQELKHRGQHTESLLLEPFTVIDECSSLYAINGMPVLTPILQTTTPSPPKATASAQTSHAPTTPVASLSLRTNYNKWLWWLLLLILLFGLAFYWWHLNRPQHETNKASPPLSAESVNFFCTDEKEVTAKAPEFTLIFDTSHSMSLNINTTLAEEKWYYATEIDNLENLRKAILLEKEPTRFAIAQHALTQMVKDLHPQLSTRLISFDHCEAIKDHGVFTPQRQEELINTINNLTPMNGTPSGEALFYAAQKMDGVDNDGIILLVIDGEDGCGVNICTIAKHIAETKPRLQINVVDITGFGLSDCVAKHTNGRVYSSNDAAIINQMLLDSIKEVSATI